MVLVGSDLYFCCRSHWRTLCAEAKSDKVLLNEEDTLLVFVLGSAAESPSLPTRTFVDK